MVPATLTSNFVIWTDSFLEEDGAPSFLPFSPGAAETGVALETPRLYWILGTRTKLVIANARAGMSTIMTMSGNQPLIPPDAVGGAAAAPAAGAAAASSVPDEVAAILD